MKLSEIAKAFSVVNLADGEREAEGVFCCDLLSAAMGKAPSGSVWVTLMANVNTLAVASLADVSCIILAEGVSFDEAAVAKAREQDITVFSSDAPVFQTALRVYEMINGAA